MTSTDGKQQQLLTPTMQPRIHEWLVFCIFFYFKFVTGVSHIWRIQAVQLDGNNSKVLTDRDDSIIYLTKSQNWGCESKEPHSNFYDTIRYLHRRAHQAKGASSTVWTACVRLVLWFAARDMKGLNNPHGLCGDRARRVHDHALLVTFPF